VNATSRPYLIYKVLNSYGYDTKVAYSIFSHSRKIYRKYSNPNFITINTQKYENNISITRLFSHVIYCANIVRHLFKNSYHLIYIIVPPNFTAGIIISMFKKNRYIISDFIDVWPEAFPFSPIIKKVVLNTIGVLSNNLRKYITNNSDITILESNYFKKFLPTTKLNDPRKLKIMLLKKYNYQREHSEKSDVISFCYIGNIGEIYDFDSLLYILSQTMENKRVFLNIIGEGNKKEWLIQSIENNCIPYKYYGPIYDERIKCAILSSCWWGFNGYKENTEVSLSYKSIDYLSYGVPMINSAKGDTKEFIDNYMIGFNYRTNNLDALVKKIINIDNTMLKEMSNNCLEIFNKYFTMKTLKEDIKDILERINL